MMHKAFFLPESPANPDSLTELFDLIFRKS